LTASVETLILLSRFSAHINKINNVKIAFELGIKTLRSFSISQITSIPKKLKVIASVLVASVVAIYSKGSADMYASRRNRKRANSAWDIAIADLNNEFQETDKVVRDYGEFQIQVRQDTVSRLADWMEKNEALVKRLNFKRVDGVRVHIPNIPKLVARTENISVGVKSLVNSFGVGVVAQSGAIWGVATYASAGTGTVITSLSGAAAENAILAWLGGGSLSAGGGGVAAGGAVLNLVTVLPMLLIGGLTVGVIGAKQKTNSLEYGANINVAIKRIELTKVSLGAVKSRVMEFSEILDRFVDPAEDAIAALEALDFDPLLHASDFLRAYQIVVAIKEVTETPILDQQSGKPTKESIKIVRKFR